jgi:glutathione S-transferase
MAHDLVFYTNPMSRGRIVRWMLEEVGQPYHTEILQYGTTMKAPEYLAINPMGKVPAIVHKGTIVTEAAAICTYLADAFPDAGLIPKPGDPLRGTFYRWMFYAAGPVEAAVTNKSQGFVAAPGKAGMIGYGSFEQVMTTLDGLLSGREFIVGDKFSAADVYLGSQIGFGLQFGTMEKRASFEKYYAGISARPAAEMARAMDDALLAAKG